MIARIIAIGDELLLGRTLDSNSAHLSRELTDLGFQVEGIEVVGDDQAAITAAFARARHASVVVTTGGLGPTDDDRTRHALAAALRAPLREDATAWQTVLDFYARVRPGGVIPASNRRQALLPRGSSAIANDRGSAPGVLASMRRRHGGTCHIACLPGVPHEMTAMFAQLKLRISELLPRLRIPIIQEIHFTGIGESAAQERIAGLFSESRPRVGITVSEQGHLTLRVVGSAAAVARRSAQLRARLRPFLLPEAGIAASLVGVLRRKALTISVAESCTCGRVVAQLGGIAGLSQVLREGLIAYHPQVKIVRLGVSARMLARCGVVSEAVAGAMAQGMKRRANSDIAVATTGFAGPGQGAADPEVGRVCLGVAYGTQVHTRSVHLTGNRERIQIRAAAHALQFAWQVLCSRNLRK